MKNRKIILFIIACFTILLLITIENFKSNSSNDLIYSQAISYYHKGDLDKAERLFSNINKKSENYKNTELFLGKIYYYQKKYKHAYELFQNSWQKDNSNLYILEWLIKVSFILNIEKEELNSYLSYYIDKIPNNPEILYLYGMSHEKNKNLTNAIHFYRKALEHSDSVYLSLGRLEKIYNRLGLKERNEMLKIKMKKLRGKYEKN